MSTLTQITKQLTALTNTVNTLISKAKKTDELSQQQVLELESMVRVFHAGVSKYVTVNQILGAGATDRHHVHNQGIASTVWNVQHGLNKFPAVTIHDSAGNEIEGHVEHVTINSYNVTFNAAFAGKAVSN